MADTGAQGIDLNGMSLDELKRLQREIGKAIADYDARQKQEARAEVEALLQKRGLTFADIADVGTKPSRSQGAPKYRHPENPSITWTGRGRRPEWIREALAKGQSVEALLIG